MSKGNLILINGSSSSGKTSTCRAIQDILQDQYMLLGIDVYSQIIPPKQNNVLTMQPEYFSAAPYVKNGRKYYTVTTGQLLDPVIMTSYKSIATFLDANINVISDQLFWSPKWVRAALNTLIQYKVFLVGLFVSEDEGSRRERFRGSSDGQNILEDSRADGWNRTSAEMTHKNMIYDFEIDNTHLSIEETAKKIITAFNNTKDPTAFKRLYETFKDC